ncbi:MAG: DUF3025 domain-containing protein [Burkholderiales bacterium]|nr:DUF3025 domain-containing protein [Burkholderiales bacterium]MCA3161216.1 DUF3025 domain-containing protein [Burkholderiales bacterium]MCA3164208.1 DUF3025 domain-containing protein [Burkholderiales bacterium]MCA3165911.1 DUF3025 domain-containing protein [Burkholderiales bacterium]MCA3170783.1 DUF3025 domain-containing protein [Burkholderiales bacterium]
MENAPLLSDVDWQHPIYSLVREMGQRFVALENLPDQLNACDSPGRTAQGKAVSFMTPAAGLPFYELHIAESGQVPTRNNLHDFFNALVWFSLPRTKAMLNQRQVQAIKMHGIGASRGAVRDTLTLIDESAALLITTVPEALTAWHTHDWHTLFVQLRHAWQYDIRLVVLGHALMENWGRAYRTGYQGLTAKVWHVPFEPGKFECMSCLDAWFAQQLLRQQTLEPCQLRPLPLCGVPGWWPDQSWPGFYQNKNVFRPKRPG